MELTLAICGTLIVLSSLAAVVAVAVQMGRTARGRVESDESLIVRMGDKLVANSDYQIERMRIENAASPLPVPGPRLNGWMPPADDEPVVEVPGRA